MLFHTYNLREKQLALPQVMSVPVAAAIVKSSVGVIQSQTSTSVLTSQTYRINWDVLVGIYGGEDRLAEAAHLLRKSGRPDGDPELRRALDLVDRYLGGFRPTDPFATPDDE